MLRMMLMVAAWYSYNKTPRIISSNNMEETRCRKMDCLQDPTPQRLLPPFASRLVISLFILPLNFSSPNCLCRRCRAAPSTILFPTDRLMAGPSRNPCRNCLWSLPRFIKFLCTYIACCSLTEERFHWPGCVLFPSCPILLTPPYVDLCFVS